jgi:hypothetical protein
LKNSIGLLKITLLDVDLSQRFCHDSIHGPSINSDYKELENNPKNVKMLLSGT